VTIYTLFSFFFILFRNFAPEKGKNEGKDMYVELMQFSAILLMSLLALKLFLLPRNTITSDTVRMSRWFLFIGTSLLAIQFLLQYILGLRARGVTLAVMLNLAVFIPCTSFFSLAVLYLQRKGQVNYLERYIGVPVWFLAMGIIAIGIMTDNLLTTEIIATGLYAAMQLFYTARQMRYMRHLRETLANYYDADMDYVLRWMEWSVIQLTLMAVMVPVIIFGHGLLLAIFALLFFFGIFYLVDSFCLFVVSNTPAKVVEAETGQNETEPEERVSDDACNRVEQAVDVWVSKGGHLKAGLNMPGAAEEIGVPRYLLSCWLRQKGVRYSDWLAEMRIDEAKRVLRDHPDWSNETVAEHCGFSDRTYFQRKFKEITGMTPHDFLNL
jgi:AraC-like DNA-binding protein